MCGKYNNMKKIIAVFLTTFMLLIGLGLAQDFTITNKFVMTNTVEVITTFNLDLTPVVSSAGAPMTNNSAWGPWIPVYMDSQIYTNGLTTNNVVDVKVLWGEPERQIRNYYQGTPATWNGKFYTTLGLAKERILAGQRMHVLLSLQDNDSSLTNLVNGNVVWAVNGLVYKVIEIPVRKPDWLVVP